MSAPVLRPTVDLLTGAGFDAATVVAIAAHPDDIEIGMPFAPISAISDPRELFAGITCTDGTAGFRAPGYERMSDSEFAKVRRDEQRCAAVAGQYLEQAQLGFNEKEEPTPSVVAPLAEQISPLLLAAQPHTIVTHSPLDRHPWHRAVAKAAVEVAKGMTRQPVRFLGVEIWGSLEWLSPHVEVIYFDDPDGLCARWKDCYASQEAHTPYMEAAAARRFVNGTYRLGRTIGVHQEVVYALDLLPLLEEEDVPSWLCQLAIRAATEHASGY